MSAPSRRFSTRRVLFFLLASILVIAAGRFVREETRPVLLAGPMVQMPTPDTLCIVWRMKSPVGEGAVAVLPPKNPPQRITASRKDDFHVATIGPLDQNGVYTYTLLQSLPLGDRSLCGPIQTRTPPNRTGSIRFLAFGDSGDGGNAQADLARVMAAAKPDLLIHTGDLIYPAGDASDYAANFFEPYAELIRSVPFMPCLGNHDVATARGAPFLDVFVLPRNGPDGIEPERNYYFDYGPARFVALDSNDSKADGVITADQRRDIVAPWLRKVLTDCDARWKFVYYHHPFYTGSEHPADGALFMKEPFVRVFEECRVDMVFCGHNHLYERTAPLKQDKVMPDGRGIVYITTGAGGARRYPENLPPPPYIKVYNADVFSFTQIDLTPERLELRQIDEHGKTIDEYVLTGPRKSTMTDN